MSEAAIQRECEAFLRSVPGCHIERVIAGRGGKHYRIRGATAGTADFLGSFRGRALALEIKNPETVAKKYAGKEPRRPAQIAWQATWEAAGGLYWCVRSVAELAKLVAGFSDCSCARCARG